MTSLVQTGGRSLVAAAATTSLPQEPTQYLTFMLGGEIYAIGILSIKEIIEYGGLTTVPMMPGAIRGVINLRGAVVPVMDLATRFGQPSSEITKRTCIVIVELEHDGEQHVIGVVVDSVNAVQEIAPGDVEPAPSFGMKIAPDLIAGMGKVNGKFVILLNIQQVLSISQLTNLQGILAPESAADQGTH
ncbi:chemotaxis protein CheW [Rhodoferax sp. AJA081-3]|uniref:chemotaxis protein CheW n=1 Tax=Rhodoferax sp. AJA081-3 TaxID=2752316 RepID=UPI001AE0AA73|nr:chemotaxis protein CheW [Rhodoferax sp. AJA081-3]QTN28969.1 chemotaxis protein CheW [Rhodoferax sp. AJA081-3]